MSAAVVAQIKDEVGDATGLEVGEDADELIVEVGIEYIVVDIAYAVAGITVDDG